MKTPRISASSYSNTAPLIWSFIYGSHHGKVELILDNAPRRSAELLSAGRVDAALVPVIASQFIENIRLIPDVCIGAKRRVRSVCLVTKGEDLENIRSVSLDASSQTSVALTKIIFREFLRFEPVWRESEPDLGAMLAESDGALLIGDPALANSEMGLRNVQQDRRSEIQNLRLYDLAEIWHQNTGLGFVFAMWMTRHESWRIDLAAARDEGLKHLGEIAGNYAPELGLGREELLDYLSRDISYSIEDTMREGMELFFELASKHGLVNGPHKLTFATP